MLLQLENTDSDSLKKLMDYARQLNLRLSLIDEQSQSSSLPGKPLSAANLRALIETSRQSGTISMNDAHAALRKKFDAD